MLFTREERGGASYIDVTHYISSSWGGRPKGVEKAGGFRCASISKFEITGNRRSPAKENL